jgi:predicted phage baseplate assembly protein
LNALPVVQREPRASASLGFSRGLPDEAFPLALQGLMAAEDVRIEVGVGQSFRAWAATRDLAASGPDDAHFWLNRKAGLIVFGNGVNGCIPPKGAQIRHLDYALTRGRAGNVAASLRWRVLGAPMREAGASYGRNHATFIGGTDAWNADDLRRAARIHAFERQALLSDAELAAAAKSAAGLGVERAEVQLGHPALAGYPVPGARLLIVTPERAPEVDPLTAVPYRYVQAVQRVLSPRRVLGERLTVTPTRRVAVSVMAELLIEDGRDELTVSALGVARLNQRLSDVQIPGGPPAWPAGRAVTRAELQALLAGIEGVIAVTECRLARLGQPHGVEPVQLRSDEIAIGRDHLIRVRSVRERAE